MSDQDLAFESGEALRRKLLKKEVSARELARLFLDRIAVHNGTVNAYQLVLDKEALAAADTIDALIAKGDVKAPLLGLPVCIPDLEAMAGYPMTKGSALLKDTLCKEDCSLVTRLRQAGAIILGKTRVSEFGFGSVTESPQGGAVLNPWDASTYAGGPSAGTSAAVSAGLATAAMESDSFGSIRLGAGICGVLGLKAGRGRIPKVCATLNPATERLLLQRGVLARHVEDAAGLLHVLAQPDPCDTLAVKTPPTDYLSGLADLPVGLKAGWSPSLGFIESEAIVLETLKPALEQFRGLGVGMEEAGVELSEDALIHLRHLIAVDRYMPILKLFENYRNFFGKLSEVTRDWLAIGNSVTGVQYSLACSYMQWLDGYLLEKMQGLNFLITPSSPLHCIPKEGVPMEVRGKEFDTDLGPNSFALPFNLAGYPAMVLPAGFSEEHQPIAFQVIARKGQEGLLLQLAYAWQQRFPWQNRRPSLA